MSVHIQPGVQGARQYTKYDGVDIAHVEESSKEGISCIQELLQPHREQRTIDHPKMPHTARVKNAKQCRQQRAPVDTSHHHPYIAVNHSIAPKHHSFAQYTTPTHSPSFPTSAKTGWHYCVPSSDVPDMTRQATTLSSSPITVILVPALIDICHNLIALLPFLQPMLFQPLLLMNPQVLLRFIIPPPS